MGTQLAFTVDKWRRHTNFGTLVQTNSLSGSNMRTEVIKEYLRNRDAEKTPLVDLDLKEYTIEAEQLSDIGCCSVLLATTAVDAVELAMKHAPSSSRVKLEVTTRNWV